MADPADPLESWVVATFDVVAFGLVAVLIGHGTGGLADVLPGIGTLPGVLAFGYLWALVVVATRWVLGTGGLARCRDGELSTLVSRGAAAGGIVGAAFVTGVFLVTGLVIALSGSTDLPVFLSLAAIGAGVGGVIGIAVGTALALVNVGCYLATDPLVAASVRGATATADDTDGTGN